MLLLLLHLMVLHLVARDVLLLLQLLQLLVLLL